MCQPTTNRDSVRRLCLSLSDLGFRILGLELGLGLGLGLRLGSMIQRKLSSGNIANLRIVSVLDQI